MIGLDLGKNPRNSVPNGGMYCRSVPSGSAVETDTYLAAFALCGGLDFVSFDRGIARFQGVRVIVPS